MACSGNMGGVVGGWSSVRGAMGCDLVADEQARMILQVGAAA